MFPLKITILVFMAFGCLLGNAKSNDSEQSVTIDLRDQMAATNYIICTDRFRSLVSQKVSDRAIDEYVSNCVTVPGQRGADSLRDSLKSAIEDPATPHAYKKNIRQVLARLNEKYPVSSPLKTTSSEE